MEHTESSRGKNAASRLPASTTCDPASQVQYSVIEPKAQRRYRTFVTHPWIIRETGTKQRMMLGQRMVRLFFCVHFLHAARLEPSAVVTRLVRLDTYAHL